MGGNPLYLMIPVTISCCHAFMLPVGTPCNAMVISTTKIETSYMVSCFFCSHMAGELFTEFFFKGKSRGCHQHFHACCDLWCHRRY